MLFFINVELLYCSSCVCSLRSSWPPFETVLELLGVHWAFLGPSWVQENLTCLILVEFPHCFFDPGSQGLGFKVWGFGFRV